MAYCYNTDTLRYYDGDRIRVKEGEWNRQEGLFMSYEGLEKEAAIARVEVAGIVRIVPLNAIKPIPPAEGDPNTTVVQEDLYQTMVGDAQELYKRVSEMVERIERMQVTNVNPHYQY
jgi:hypothetical protein